jgi:hypothetical protein
MRMEPMVRKDPTVATRPGTWYNLCKLAHRDDEDNFMGTPVRSLEQLTKVVVAFLDRRRQRGYTYDFSAMRDSLNLLPAEDPLQGQGTKVDLKDVKALFFVRDFVGNKDAQDSPDLDSPAHGRKIEVSFSDGEKLVGKTEGYNRQKLGFFVFPADPKSNNLRIFVVTKNARFIRFL